MRLNNLLKEIKSPNYDDSLIESLNTSLEDFQVLSELSFSINSMTESLETVDSMINSLTNLTELAEENIAMKSSDRQRFVPTLIACTNEILRPLGGLKIESIESYGYDSFSILVATESIKERIQALIKFFQDLYKKIKEKVVEFFKRFRKSSAETKKNTEMIKENLKEAEQNYSEEKEKEVKEITEGEIVIEEEKVVKQVLLLEDKSRKRKTNKTKPTKDRGPIEMSDSIQGPIPIDIKGLFLKEDKGDFNVLKTYMNNGFNFFDNLTESLRSILSRTTTHNLPDFIYKKASDWIHDDLKETENDKKAIEDIAFKHLKSVALKNGIFIRKINEHMNNIKSTKIDKKVTGIRYYYPIMMGGIVPFNDRPLDRFQNMKADDINDIQELDRYLDKGIKQYNWGKLQNKDALDHSDRIIIAYKNNISVLYQMYEKQLELLNKITRDNFDKKIEDRAEMNAYYGKEYLGKLSKNGYENNKILNYANKSIRANNLMLLTAMSINITILTDFNEIIISLNNKVGKS